MNPPKESCDVNKEPVLFSIIVTACNVARYIKDAIDSIKNQTVNDFEVLVLCEESTDGTLEVCRVECDHDERFTIYPLPCSGSPSIARNLGMKSAKGRHVIFLDGDDWLEYNTVERFRDALVKANHPDIIFASCTQHDEHIDGSRCFNSCRTNLSKKNEGEIFSGQEAILRMWRENRTPMCSVYMGIYRLDFLLEHNFMQMPGIRYEDLEWCPRVWFFAQCVTVLDLSYYNYRKRPYSITTLPRSQNIHDLAKVFNSRFDFYFSQNLNAELKKAWASQCISAFFWFFYNPQYRNHYPEMDRKKALASFLRHQGFKRYIQVVKEASLPKRLSIVPLAFYYWFGTEIPAKIYFRCFYFPLLSFREKLKKGKWPFVCDKELR